MLVNIGGAGKHAYELEEAVELDLNVAASWDTTTPTDYTNAANRAGKDFYIYVCEPESGFSPKIVLSAATTWPAGYTAENSRKIGGFHCLPGDCINLPSGHPYKDYIQGDILFNSIWDLIDRPRSPPEGMVKISLTPSDGEPALWCDIYLASGTGTTCTSVFGATIQDGKDWNTFVEYGRLQNKRLMRDAEFQMAATGSNEQTNIANSADPGTVTFPLDTAGRSMISHYGCIGMCGVMYQWLDEQGYRFDGATAHTHQVTVSGDPETVISGNPSADVAPTWTWQNMSSKGSRYKQGTYGDIKLPAGGYWAAGSSCGSRCRALDAWPWGAKSNIGGRFAAEPV